MKTVTAIRTCKANMSGRYGFVWPRLGRAECNDWEPTPKCGNGLHALRDGVGNGSLLHWHEDAVWLVLQRPDDADVIDLGGKVKAPWWDVLFAGTRQAAIEYAATNCGLDPSKCVGGRSLSSGIGSQASSMGEYSQASSSGDYSQASSSGDSSHASSNGISSRSSSSGDYSEASSSGNNSRASSSGEYSRASSSGDSSQASSSGYRSQASSSGDRSRASSSGEYSEASAIGKDSAAASVGVRGRVATGERGAIAVLYRDGNDQLRFACGVVGEDGIKPNTWYRADCTGQLIEDGSVVESNEGKER
jgi:hypothetical protein